MKIALLLAALAAGACKAPEAPIPAEAPSEAPETSAVPTAEEQNRVEKYVSTLQEDVKRAEAAKEKADAANKKAREAEKLPE